METYEQKYNIALDWARKVYPHTCGKEKEDLERVFPDLKESEDERIRKHLLTHFKNKTKETWCCMPVKDIVAWLEKQKEQKPAEYPEKGNEYWFGFNEGKGTVLDNPEQFGLYRPAEWSEEDEKMIRMALECLNYVSCQSKVPVVNWLKSLRPRPRWKPSNEQMWALDVALENFYNQNDRAALESLRTDLQKLLSL